jgi:fumarate hydratase class II
MHIAAYKMLMETTIPGITKLRDTLAAKSKAFMHVVKIGRTHFMDATPLTVGQEFSGYVAQLTHGLKAINNSLRIYLSWLWVELQLVQVLIHLKDMMLCG